ncbi:MAG: chemotaxis protein CheW [Methanolobus sp.]
MNDVSISGKGPTDELLQMVVFQLGGEEFGVEIMKVQEIIRMPEITQIPQSPEYVEVLSTFVVKLLW